MMLKNLSEYYNCIINIRGILYFKPQAGIYFKSILNKLI